MQISVDTKALKSRAATTAKNAGKAALLDIAVRTVAQALSGQEIGGKKVVLFTAKK